MKTNNPLAEKAYAFALRVIELRHRMHDDHGRRDISKQVLRRGTSIGANVEGAIGGESRKHFQHKLAIADKEVRETHYWLRLLRDSGTMGRDLAESLLDVCDELLKRAGSSLLTLKGRSRSRPEVVPHSSFSTPLS